MHKYIEKINVNVKECDTSKLDTIIDFIKKSCTSKFDEKIDVVYKVNIEPKKESVRGSVVLSYGIKKIKPFKICLFTDEKITLEENMILGNESVIQSVKSGEKLDVDLCLTTPTFFPKLVTIAKPLSSMGLMPNSKEGTVVNNLTETAKQIQAGRQIKFRNDPSGYIHVSIGRQSQDTGEIINNIKEVSLMINSFNSGKKKGSFIQSVCVASTMGKFSIKIPLKFIF